MIHTTYIYFLHKGDNIPFYIGKSINPDLRKAEHRWKKKGGTKPDFVIIDEVPTSEWLFWEKWYIELFKSWGFILENKNHGGGGMVKHSDESRLKISNSLKGKIHSKETKEKMKNSALGRHHTAPQSEKLSQSLKEYYLNNDGSFKGKKHTIETISKISKPIYAFDKKGNLIEEYDSLKSAGEAHQTHSGNIIKSIKRNGSLHGLIWKYKK
jgi:hypothetical protein